MKEKQKNKSTNIELNLLAIILIILTTVFSSIGYYAWARYRSSTPGDAVAKVAKWNFELRAGQDKEMEPTLFAMTRTDGYGHVVEATLAPGTFGEIPVFVDMTGTEVLTKLELTFTIIDCPRNIKFYASEADRTNNKPMKITQTRDGNNKYVTTIEVIKYYSIEDENADDYVGKVHNETIYWKWAYETLDSGNSSTAGDEIDKEDSGKEAQIVITARATEVLEKALTLKDVDIKVGDTINYTKGNTEIKGIVVNKTDSLVEFMPLDNEDKAQTVGSLTLGYNEGTADNTEQAKTEAIASYNNAVQLVNNKAKEGFINTYGFDGASRALAVEDVNRLIKYTQNPSTTQYTYTSSAPGDKRFIVDELTMVTTQNGTKKATELGISVGETVTIGNAYGGETVQSVTMICTTGESTNAYYYYNSSSSYLLSSYFSSTTIWLASRCQYFDPYYCSFRVRYCSSSNTGGNDLYSSNGGASSHSCAVVPVVSISSNIQVKAGATSGVWEVKN